jgi:hypothetical protein
MMVKGFRDEYHPNRQVGSARWAQDINDFGGGDFSSQIPTSPPQSEQTGRGNVVDEWQNEYQEIGNTGAYRTPDRMMTVGTMTQAEAAARHPPQSEQPGRGVLAPNADERLTQWYQENQPTIFEEGGYLAPVVEYMNDQQFTPS